MRRLPLVLSLIATFIAGAIAPVSAQKWPEKPITVIMGFPAGSGVDVIARLLQAPLEQDLGTQLVFDYKVGAGGNVASEVVAKARPDGYTILLGTSATHGVNAALYKKLPFDVEADFTPIAPLNDVSNVLTINPAVIDATTLADFIAKVKAAPGKYNFASTGNGTGTHLAFAQLVNMAGLDMVHVPFKGGPEALQAVVTGEVCCIMNQVQTVLGQWRAGKVRLLGVTTKQRVGAVQDVPTIDEAGLPGYESYIWFGLFGPKGLDASIAAKINLAVRKALDVPAVREKLVGLGNTPRYETVVQFHATVKADRAKWAEVVKASGASID
jgi:tripartite-type tricarboxylate transporter receptor subunit TctC